MSAAERFIPSMTGAVRHEHLHRYYFARQWVSGRRVLDIASGEGYGSSILAVAATEVVGADVAPDAVATATIRYRRDNLRFVTEEITALSFPFGTFDLVVCFETIEHVERPTAALDELRRVLRPGGLLIISTPDKGCYQPGNPFHLHEFTEVEFVSELRARFANVELFRQRSVAGSCISPAAVNGGTGTFLHWTTDGEDTRELAGAPYLLAVCSDAAVPARGFGLYDTAPQAERVWHIVDHLYGGAVAEADFLRARLDRLRLSWWGRLLIATRSGLRRIGLLKADKPFI